MATTTYWFTTTDYVPPFIRNRSPASGSAGVSTETAIAFDLLDDYSGVILSSTNVYVSGALAFDGYVFQAPFSGTVIPTIVDGYDGYAFSMASSSAFPPSTSVPVRVTSEDFNGNALDETWSFHTEAAVIGAVSGLYEITLDVEFSGDMTVESALVDPANYQFDGGMYARLVEVLEPSAVRLWVELFQGEGPFTLTVSSDIKDDYGAPITGANAEFAGITPFQSEATMAASNGLVRTWAGRGPAFPRQGSRLAWLDTQRVYLAGSRGIDAFRRDTAGTVVRWAQVFDAYGIGSLFVANYDGDYVFDDTTGPFVENRLPPAGSTDAPGTTDIRFSIGDAVTAVEIVSSAIYVNGVLVFAGGYEGWSNGWSGDIRARHRALDFVLRPPSAFTPGTTVSVRIVASDLLDNPLDTTYSFRISTAPATFGAFGTGSFGAGSFGGP